MIDTLSLPRTGKFAILVSALVYTGATFGIASGAAPVNAAGAPYYTATLAAPVAADTAVVGGVAWACEGNTCVAGKAAARPLRVCRSLNRKFGEVATFKVLGEPIEAEELAKCNG